MTPRFSVIISSHNYRAFVIDAIESALAQTLVPSQVVVIDDGSTDGSVALLQERYGGDPRVDLILKENGGQLSAFVTGIAAASAEIVCFLDADDLWEPDHLERLAAGFAHPTAPDFVYTNMRFFGQREGLWHAESNDHDLGLTVILTYCLQHWLGSPTSAVAMRRSLAQQILDLPQSLISDFRSNADEPLVFGASLFGARKRYLGAVSVGYRAHNNNLWLDRPADRIDQMRCEFRLDRLFAHYTRATGLGPDSLRRVRREFETKLAPTAEELRLYKIVASRALLPFGKRLELAYTMRRHYRRTQRTGER